MRSVVLRQMGWVILEVCGVSNCWDLGDDEMLHYPS